VAFKHHRTEGEEMMGTREEWLNTLADMMRPSAQPATSYPES